MRIRAAAPADAAALCAIYAPYVQGTAITFEYEVPTEAAFARRIRETLEKHPYLTAEESGVPVGYAYAHPFRSRAAYAWAAEVSIYLRQDCRGQGVGKQLYTALEAILQAQGVRNLYACITVQGAPDDPYLTDASPRFHAKMGYTEVAHFHGCGCKFGRWYDSIWMEKIIGTHGAHPAPVRTFPEIRASLGY